MPKVIVKTGRPFDGEYDLDLTHFTMRERAYIKEVAGVRPPEYAENWFGADPLTVIATVGVMLQRAGRRPDIDALLDANDDAITVDYSDLENDGGGDGPPSPSPSKNDELGGNNDAPAASGPGSSKPSGRQDNDRKGTGSRSSETE